MSNLFDVYTLMDIEPAHAKGAYFWDKNGEKYLDFYGGHAVISIGHTHPVYVEKIQKQLHKIAFYSNAVQNPLQELLAEKLLKLSGCKGYQLFLCNSGAEANENALKLASFTNGRKKILAFRHAFHGRTSAAVAITDNPAIQAPVNQNHEITFIPLNDKAEMQKCLRTKNYAAVIVEGIQGVGGIREVDSDFLHAMRALCDETDTYMIVDEVQSGYGRTGKFFAHEYAQVRADIITMAKGMGNGFPIGGLLIHPRIKAKKGMLGTTFGGSHLACAAALAVLEVMDGEKLIDNVQAVGAYLMAELKKNTHVRALRGKGLMIGIDVAGGQLACRNKLCREHKIMVGYSGTDTIRLLPPLCISKADADIFLHAFAQSV